MRKVFLVLALAAGSVFAQDIKVGFGVGLEKSLIQFGGGGDIGSMATLEIIPVNFSTFSVPILIGGKTRVEPEIGYVRFGSESSSQDENFESTSSVWQLGLGISGGKRMDNLLYLFGVKGGLIYRSSSFEDESFGTEVSRESSQLNFHIGPIVGAEYFFHSNLSLGAQVGLSYIHVGEEDVDDSEPTGVEEDEDSSEYMIGNNAKISLRWYY